MFLSPVEHPGDALSLLLARGAARAGAFGTDHAALWGALTEATERGKRFRPALLVAAHDAFAGRRPEAAAVVAAAVELLHTAFVIHDDVIDGDDVRRGRLNVSGSFTARATAAGAPAGPAAHFGVTAGILAGDLALTGAIRAVATCPAPSPTIHRLLDLFDQALHATAAGELADVRLALDLESASLPEVLLMEQLKTSGYSFRLPLQAGAVLADASAEVVARLGEAGRLLGIAFQLHDDLLGVFGDPAVTGKSSLGDLREGKHTVLVAFARTTPAWPRLSQLLGQRDLTGAQAAEARALLADCGSRRFVEDLVQDHLGHALALLDVLGMPTSVLTALFELVSDVAGRAA